MKLPIRFVAFALLAPLLAPAPARAETEYDFAKALIERREPSFATDDLVERLIARLEETANSALDAKLIKATLRRRQAADATAERRPALLSEAEGLFKEVAAAPHYALADTAKHELETLGKEVLSAEIRAIGKADPVKAAALRSQAVAGLEKDAAALKAKADEAMPKFQDLVKKLEEQPGGENKHPSRELIAEVDKDYDDWIVNEQKYLQVKLEEIETYDEADAARKPLAAELTALCDKRVEDDNVERFAVVLARYYFLQGCIYAAVNDEDNATKAWKNALNVEAGQLSDDEIKQMFLIKKAIMKQLIKLKMKNKHYADVEETIIQERTDPQMRQIFEQDLGKDLLIDYAKAIAYGNDTADDQARAVQEMHDAIGREQKKGAATIWANEFARATAEILLEARRRSLVPTLDADEWYDAAHGFFLMGWEKNNRYEKMLKEGDAANAKPLFDDAYGDLQNSVDYYRRAIAVARKTGNADLAMRLTIEPKAWFEMGLAYSKMKHYFEALIVNSALRDEFLKGNREKWLPDPKKESRLYTRPVLDALAELDKPKEQQGLLAKAGINILYCLDQAEKAYRGSPWISNLRPRVLGTSGNILKELDLPNDTDYLAANADMEAAGSALETAHLDPNEENRQALYVQAAEKFVSAAEKMSKVRAGTDAYEFALIQRANCLTQAQELYESGKIALKNPKETDARSRALAQQALAAFDAYDQYAAKKPVTQDKDKIRRAAIEGVELLARNALDCTLEKWDDALKSSDAYSAWEERAAQDGHPPGKSGIEGALLNKFRATYELATARVAPACDPYLAAAEDVMKKLHKDKPKDAKVYVFMLGALAKRNAVAAAQLREQRQNPGADAEKLQAGIDAYEMKEADLQSERLDALGESKDEELTLADYYRLMFLFKRTNQNQRCADFAQKLLAKFDPENKNCKISDDEKVWQELLAKMSAIIRYDDHNKEDNCRADHMLLVDFMYDTAEGAQYPEKDPRRPPYDQYKADLDKAAERIETIKKNYPDCATLNPEKGQDGKAYLTLIQEEIDYRRKIKSTRHLLADVAVHVAMDMRKDGREDLAHAYRDVAEKQIKIIIDNEGEKPELFVTEAQLQVMDGSYDEAIKTLLQAKSKVPSGSELYFDASRQTSEIYALQNKWNDAADFPLYVTQVARTEGLRRWPEMDAFLEECYQHGVPRTAGLKKAPPAPNSAVPAR